MQQKLSIMQLQISLQRAAWQFINNTAPIGVQLEANKPTSSSSQWTLCRRRKKDCEKQQLCVQETATEETHKTSIKNCDPNRRTTANLAPLLNDCSYFLNSCI